MENASDMGYPNLGCATVKPPQINFKHLTAVSLPQFPLAETQQAPPLSTGVSHTILFRHLHVVQHKCGQG